MVCIMYSETCLQRCNKIITFHHQACSNDKRSQPPYKDHIEWNPSKEEFISGVHVVLYINVIIGTIGSVLIIEVSSFQRDSTVLLELSTSGFTLEYVCISP